MRYKMRAQSSGGWTAVDNLSGLTLDDPSGVVTGRSANSVTLVDNTNADGAAGIVLLDLGALPAGSVFIGEIERDAGLSDWTGDYVYLGIGAGDAARTRVVGGGLGRVGAGNDGAGWYMPDGGTITHLASTATVKMRVHVAYASTGVLSVSVVGYDAAGAPTVSYEDTATAPAGASPHAYVMVGHRGTTNPGGTLVAKSIKWQVV